MYEPLASERQICNLQASLVRLGGNAELLREMIGFYLEDYRTLLQRIETAADSGDPTTLSRGAHSLKGLAANFDGFEVVEAANAVTKAVGAGFGRAPQKEIAILAAAAEDLADRLQAASDGEDFG